MLTVQVIKLSGVIGFLSRAWHRIAVYHRQVGANNPPSDVMMEQSQVRWAILLSRAPLKVRRLHSLPLLSGPDCRSLKLYWVSAKAPTLPISQHASSQLSLPSGLRPSPERINIPSPCSRYACDAPSEKLASIYPDTISFLALCDEIFSHQLKTGNLLPVWFSSSGAPVQSSTISVFIFRISSPHT